MANTEGIAGGRFAKRHLSAFRGAAGIQERLSAFHIGQVLHVDDRHVYQLSQKGLVQHNRNAREKEPVVGQNYEVAYSWSREGKERTDPDGAQKLNNSQSKSLALTLKLKASKDAFKQEMKKYIPQRFY